jgi:hypothetical protein
VGGASSRRSSVSEYTVCPVCSEPAAALQGVQKGITFYSCVDCGEYGLQSSVNGSSGLRTMSRGGRASLRHAVRWRHEHGPRLILDAESIARALQEEIPAARVRAQMVLEDLWRMAADAPYAKIELNLHRFPLFWLESVQQMENVLESLAESGLLRILQRSPDAYALHLTPKAWALQEAGFGYPRVPEI